MPSESFPVAERGVEITAPARLHFGLLAPGPGEPLRFGGLGVMVRPPRMRLRLVPAARYQLPPQDEAARRIDSVVRRFCAQWRLGQPPPVRFVLEEGFPFHMGLGAGTQLAMAAAWALLCWRQQEPVAASVQRLARLSGRGRRSAVGVYGFSLGGWIAESGKPGPEGLAPLQQRVENPPAWRWLLLRPKLPPGRSGPQEEQAFQSLPPRPDVTRRLRHILYQELLPGLARGDFPATAEALGRYSRLAGEPFVPVQGGPFAHPGVQRLVETLWDWGYPGCGQSSWGPTVFVLLPEEATACRLQKRLEAQWPEPLETLLAATDTSGAQLRVAETRQAAG